MESDQLVEIAYKKFKQYAYYEQLDLFQRKKIAEFECDPNFDKKLCRLSEIVDCLKEGTEEIDDINNLLKLVNYNLIPKKIGLIPCSKKQYSKDKDVQKGFIEILGSGKAARIEITENGENILKFLPK